VREVGRALVMTHDYNRAVKYYETRLKEDPKLLDLRIDLAELYYKLKVHEEAKRVLIDALKYIKSQETFNSLEMKIRCVKYLLLLAKVYLDQDMQMGDWKFKENESAKQALIEARVI
jgi:tetratricopeptide repeat protein 21B